MTVCAKTKLPPSTPTWAPLDVEAPPPPPQARLSRYLTMPASLLAPFAKAKPYAMQLATVHSGGACLAGPPQHFTDDADNEPRCDLLPLQVLSESALRSQYNAVKMQLGRDPLPEEFAEHHLDVRAFEEQFGTYSKLSGVTPELTRDRAYSIFWIIRRLARDSNRPFDAAFYEFARRQQTFHEWPDSKQFIHALGSESGVEFSKLAQDIVLHKLLGGQKRLSAGIATEHLLSVYLLLTDSRSPLTLDAMTRGLETFRVGYSLVSLLALSGAVPLDVISIDEIDPSLAIANLIQLLQPAIESRQQILATLDQLCDQMASEGFPLTKNNLIVFKRAAEWKLSLDLSGKIDRFLSDKDDPYLIQIYNARHDDSFAPKKTPPTLEDINDSLLYAIQCGWFGKKQFIKSFKISDYESVKAEHAEHLPFSAAALLIRCSHSKIWAGVQHHIEALFTSIRSERILATPNRIPSREVALTLLEDSFMEAHAAQKIFTRKYFAVWLATRKLNLRDDDVIAALDPHTKLWNNALSMAQIPFMSGNVIYATIKGSYARAVARIHSSRQNDSSPQ